MYETDQEKTSFVTSQGLFCYKVMPFGLKNVGATYQRLVNHMFRPQIGRNVEVYVDETNKVRLQYQKTNNEVEYEALLKGLELAKSIEAKSILILGDS